jgi:hypothetical protein
VATGVGVSVGMSLGSISSLVTTLFEGASVAILVAVQGNSYVSVPVLDFGSEHGDAAADRPARMPELSAKYPIGDTSSLSRLVLGIDEALRDYRGSGESNLAAPSEPVHDPWNEDLFAPRRTGASRGLPHNPGNATKAGQPEAMRDEPPRAPGSHHQGANERWDGTDRDDARARAPDVVDRIGAALQSLAGLVVTALYLMPRRARRARRTRFDLPLREGPR